MACCRRQLAGAAPLAAWPAPAFWWQCYLAGATAPCVWRMAAAVQLREGSGDSGGHPRPGTVRPNLRMATTPDTGGCLSRPEGRASPTIQKPPPPCPAQSGKMEVGGRLHGSKRMP